MILHEEATFDPPVNHARLAVIEAMEPAMKVHCYSTVEALGATLAEIVSEMRRHRANGWDMPEGLTRIALIFSDPRAVDVVRKHMAPGFDFAAWPQPDAWLALYGRIDELRDRARMYDPQFAPRYL